MLALLDHENTWLIGRQRRMYAADAPLWKPTAITKAGNTFGI